ncbi:MULTISPECIES: SGNH/GDSL hydrolase family protein [unclassified Nostoc]|uniref:SGNH/GDSL hydrolase family protein n=1 Tax=unclassified Nostoc TaxID=2593658 RepID=UPI002AD20BBD|nr:SGNH/GDSL hydrolase family protein [Nostoc sp. ChiQUE02]MDZ8234209.1 SGNH/GDSL hydrolase family protein [Nostoc sp. ChiQUE02]
MLKILINSLTLSVIALLLTGSPNQQTTCRKAVFFGDSITVGAGASHPTLRWSTLLSKNKGLCEDNQGIGATVLQNSYPRLANNGRDRYIHDVVKHHPKDVYILYGLNDLRYSSKAFSVEKYKSDLSEIVQGLLVAGISRANITIGSPPYVRPSAYQLYPEFNSGTTNKHHIYRDAAKSVAKEFKVRWADVYQDMISSGGDALISSDNVHPNDQGHQVIFKSMANALP